MKIIFEKEEKVKNLTLADVDDDQFFVNIDGELCQKVFPRQYNIIAACDGSLIAAHSSEVDPDEKIERILPRVTKIEF